MLLERDLSILVAKIRREINGFSPDDNLFIGGKGYKASKITLESEDSARKEISVIATVMFDSTHCQSEFLDVLKAWMMAESPISQKKDIKANITTNSMDMTYYFYNTLITDLSYTLNETTYEVQLKMLPAYWEQQMIKD
jgi:hypothetical protein